MKVFRTDHFDLPLPPAHRFPLAKYALLRQRVAGSGLLRPGNLLVPHAATDEELLRVHDAAYLERVKAGTLSAAEVRRLGFPWSPELVERARRSCGATVEACRWALAEGVAVHLAGGTHHAFRDAGEGYCVFNDAAVAARAVQAEGRVGRVLVVDGDVHQGNGTAAIFRDDPSVFTFSIHARRNFPLRKESSDLDVELEDGAGDRRFLTALDCGLSRAFQLAEAGLVIYLAGADPFEGDRLGLLAVTKEGLAERDRLVFGYCRRAGVPVAVTMAGGYAERVEDAVDIHFNTVAAAAELWADWPRS